MNSFKKHPAKTVYGRKSRLHNILAMALIICAMALASALLDKSGGSSNQFQPAILQHVVDGDTIYASIDGERTKIRLIGIDTPESVSWIEENTQEGKEASRYLSRLLQPGDEIYIEYDEEPHDQYGRTLAYVWLDASADTGSYKDFCKYNLNALIYQNTYCDLVRIPPNVKYYNWFKELTPWEKK
ncbi:MAG: thermonuclease family protein [Eubacteriales bacterium]|nr:thermonuclease family protein [Eubacteriales bacterium]